VFARRLFLGALMGAAACVSVACAAAPPQEGQQGLPVEPLKIVTHDGKSHPFRVEIADTDATREEGLMFRKSLAPDAGMLFDFKTSQDVAFWMKNTLIPLDMLFIDQNGVVVSIKSEATPLSETPIPSGAPVLGVLEIRGGRAAELGVHVGDKVEERIFQGQ
jgi:uncharacterized membrane protein (UPF0127 family)